VPTIADVARLAGVSIATASRVITGSVPVTPDRAAAVRKAAADLDYVPNERARELRRGSLRAVGFLVDDLSDPYFAGIYRGIRRRLDDGRCAVVAIEVSGNAPAASDTVLRLLRSSADAMIASDSAVLTDDVLAGLDRRNVRTINFDGVAGLRGGEHEYLVRIHDRAGMRRLTEHLLDLGHRRIALVTGPPRRTSDHERSAGFQEAMEAADAEPRVLTATAWGSDDAARAVRDALAEPSAPTAIVAVEPRGADGAFDAARAVGLRVPRDLSIASFYADADSIAGAAVTSLGDVREVVAALIARALDRSEAVAPVEGELAVVPGRTSAPPPERTAPR
jgi:LacI family transcriptional regulator, galactose operon repressor